MLGQCLFCYRPFPLNGTLEAFPIGRRIAFDPEVGRLWAVCPACARWTLAPIEERWEVLEALERLAASGRVLARTQRVALIAAGDLEIVRVGRADLREESGWRFGPELAHRHARARRIERLGALADDILTGTALLVSSLLGGPLLAETDPDKWLDWARRRRFGRWLWRQAPPCPRCGQTLPGRGFHERALLLVPGAGGLAAWWPCPSCGPGALDGGQRLEGPPAEHVLRRALAWANFAGAPRETLHRALGVLERAGSARELVLAAPDQRLAPGRLPARVSFALEIALTGEAERRWLHMDVLELERRWREEEAIAAIVDRELTPLPGSPARAGDGRQ